MNLSPHFTLEELSYTEHREFDNTPSPETIVNLTRLSEFLERVKVLLGGKPIMVNSAYRSPSVNEAVGSKPSSQHCLGCAADIRVPGMTPDEVCKALIASDLPFDQLIREFDRWTHISVPSRESELPRNQALIIDRLGTRKYE